MSAQRNNSSGLAGVPVVLAILVLCGAAAFYQYALKPAEERLAAVERSLAKRTINPALQPVQLTAQTEVAGRLEQFYAFFDGELSYVDWLARFYDIAGRTGVTLQRVEYRTLEPAGIPMVVHEVSIPMAADYSRIRAFSEGVLNAVPIASLDQITFRRQRANQSEAETELRFSFYLAKK